METHEKKKHSLVDQYLYASCFNKLSDSAYKNMLNYETKADWIEKKLISKIKEKVREGKVVLCSQSKERT